MNFTPPWLPRFLASVFLPAGPARDGVLGDIYELYTTRCANAGRVRADLWYWYESGLAVVRYTVERLKRVTTFTRRPYLQQRKPKRKAGSLEAIQQDIRFAIRMLRKAPGFTVVAALTIALGIGATTTIFSVVNSVLLRPPTGIRSPSKMVRVYRIDEEGKSFNDLSYANYRAYRDGSIGIADLAGSALVSVSIRTTGTPEMGVGFLATHNFLPVLGVRPALGRFFLPEEDESPGTHLVVVLSHSTWLRRFDGDSAVIGRTINLNKHTFTVVGVTEEGFRGPAAIVDIGVYIAMSAAPILNDSFDMESREATWVSVLGRRSPGVPREQVSAAVNRISANLRAAFPEGNPDLGINVERYTPIGKQAFLAAAAVSLFLFVISGTVLLIASINVGSMLLSRATQRRREVALRLALGAGRARVVRQMLAESILLFTLGGGGGLLLTLYATKALSAFQLPIDVPFLILDFSPDMRALAFSLLVGLVTGIVFGLAPALQVTKPDLTTILKLGSGGRSSRSRLRDAFVVVQVAGSALLLVTAGLFARGLARANAVDIGFDPENVHFLSTELDFYHYSAEDAARFYRDLVERTAALPGVESVGLTDSPPIVLAGIGGQAIQFTVPGREAPLGRDSLFTDVSTVTAGFFDTIRMPMVRGRSFEDTDRDGAPMVAVINETLGRRM